MAKINKDMIIADIIAIDEGTVPILLESGLHCLGCPSAQGETLGEACEIHGIEIEELLKQLNEYLENK